MCGIVGYVGPEPTADLDTEFLRRACRAMRHRGPDGEGVWSGDTVGLGHRRLSIIDLEGGAQPMSYAGGRYWITFNGEIYNYRELRAELATLGHTFRTTSDTEVILAAYAQWGMEAPEHLRGIFALAIWDAGERRLFLARDHLGVKPLLYYWDGRVLVFSSELKAILATDAVPRDPDQEGLADYLTLGYTLGPRTVVRRIRKLPPGSSLDWHDGRVSVRTFWDLAAVALSPPRERASADEYAECFGRAVAAQMVSDVPVGAFLSGGIDSSSVVYQMRAHTPHRLKTFSMGFAEPSYSELDYADQVATALRTDHHAEVVHPDLEATLPHLIRAFDEPLGDTSIVPTYFVSRLARRHVKVVLSGDGADESLAGYETYVADVLHQLYHRVPRLLHERVFLPLSRRIPATGRKVGLDYKVRQFVAHAHGGLERAHFGWRVLFDPAESRALLGDAADGYDPFTVYRSHFERVQMAPTLNRCLYVDMSTWLVDDILTKVDRASMAVGLEARVPFLDVGLVEYTMRLPPKMKMDGLRRKVVLKEAMRGKLPEAVLRRRKSGFNAPVSGWLRGSLRPMVEELFAQPSALVDVRHPLLQSTWRAHLSGREDFGFRLWSLVTLLIWEREVLARRAPDAGQRDAGIENALAGEPRRAGDRAP